MITQKANQRKSLIFYKALDFELQVILSFSSPFFNFAP